jgi:DNA-binding MarR family transcriptional regulator
VEVDLSAIDELVYGCLAARVRLIGRAITSIYDRAVESSGLTIAQINLMAAAGKLGPCAPSKLGAVLQLERSTVSRNLDRLLDAGWMQAVSSDAKGIKEVGLTASGRRKIESILPQWREAQKQAKALLGESGVAAVRGVVDGFWTLKSTA